MSLLAQMAGGAMSAGFGTAAHITEEGIKNQWQNEREQANYLRSQNLYRLKSQLDREEYAQKQDDTYSPYTIDGAPAKYGDVGPAVAKANDLKEQQGLIGRNVEARQNQAILDAQQKGESGGETSEDDLDAVQAAGKYTDDEVATLNQKAPQVVNSKEAALEAKLDNQRAISDSKLEAQKAMLEQKYEALKEITESKIASAKEITDAKLGMAKIIAELKIGAAKEARDSKSAKESKDGPSLRYVTADRVRRADGTVGPGTMTFDMSDPTQKGQFSQWVTGGLGKEVFPDQTTEKDDEGGITTKSKSSPVGDLPKRGLLGGGTANAAPIPAKTAKAQKTAKKGGYSYVNGKLVPN